MSMIVVVVRALTTVERTYLLDSNKCEKLSKVAELELYKDSLKHDYLVISGVLQFGCSQYLIFECLLKSFDR